MDSIYNCLQIVVELQFCTIFPLGLCFLNGNVISQQESPHQEEHAMLSGYSGEKIKENKFSTCSYENRQALSLNLSLHNLKNLFSKRSLGITFSHGDHFHSKQLLSYSEAFLKNLMLVFIYQYVISNSSGDGTMFFMDVESNF